MTVSEHLHIGPSEYDDRIRTFVPYYTVMIRQIADALALTRGPASTVVDLGIGTGSLTEACLETQPRARFIGIDLDESMMATAQKRLQNHTTVEFATGNFLEVTLPPANAFIAMLSLHHVGTPLAKQKLYRNIFEKTSKGGMLLSGDCFPAVEPSLARRHRVAWLNHLQQTYSPSESEQYLEAWSGEDVYFPLDDEVGWIRDAGFRPEVIWRQDGFAVVAGFREH